MFDVQPTAELTEPSEKKGYGVNGNLRPFQKGVSGNPGGKPKKHEDVKALARQHSVKAFNRIVELIGSDDERVAIMAAKEVLDRAYGKAKPMDTEDDKNSKNVTINILRYTDANAGNHAAAPVDATAVSVRTLALS